jgi:rubrerythrin
MMQFNSVDAILDFAIAKEQEAHDFYVELATHARNAAMSAVFQEFAMEEAGHKIKLEAVKAGKKLLSSSEEIMDLRIGDYLVDVKVRPGMDYQEALIVSMKAEKNAY